MHTQNTAKNQCGIRFFLVKQLTNVNKMTTSDVSI